MGIEKARDHLPLRRVLVSSAVGYMLAVRIKCPQSKAERIQAVDAWTGPCLQEDAEKHVGPPEPQKR